MIPDLTNGKRHKGFLPNYTFLMVHPSKRNRGFWWVCKISPPGEWEGFERPLSEAGVAHWQAANNASLARWESSKWDGSEMVVPSGARKHGHGNTIYIIEAVGMAAVKIGIATDSATARVKALQAGCPAELRLLTSFSGTCKTEARIHSRFSKFRIRGEWFSKTPELDHFIASKL